VLKGARKALARPRMRRARKHFAFEQHFPGVWTLLAPDDVDQRCLTRAIGAEQGQDFASFDDERDAIDSANAAVAL
jgi:hypothetical protein